ncbi:hypothetical protein A2U01_0011829, partial [Trifolium medium]|nr:hypothetical protein [Trifolium medium]
MASATMAILMVALWHNGHRYIELQQEGNCNLCHHNSNTITDLITHMKARIHKDNLFKAKNTVLRQQSSLVNDPELIVDNFDFGEADAISDEVNSDFVPALGIEKEFDEIYSLWCEWGNVNPQPNVVDEDDQHDHDDGDSNRVKDRIDAIIVMKGSSNNASEICFLCDHRMNADMDVAALLDSQNNRIICCNWKLFSARNKGKDLGG